MGHTLNGAFKTFLDRNDVTTDLLKTDSLVFVLRDQRGEIVLRLRDLVIDLHLLKFDFLHNNSCVSDYERCLLEFFLKNLLFKTFVFLSNRLEVNEVFLYPCFLLGQLVDHQFLLIVVSLHPIKLENQHILVDNRVINSNKLSLELIIILILRFDLQ